LNRLITQIGQSIYEWFFTKPAQDNMIAHGKLAAAVLGTSTIANGLACAPTSPASLQVSLGPGEIYALAPLEATVFGTLAADTTHQVFKQGILLDPTLVSCPPPPTAGQAINYLVQVQYQDQDVSLDPTTGNATPVVLQFYNSSNPSQPWQGPNNSGQTSNTFRKGIVAIQAKAGIAATTGTQVTPAADTGWTGIWVVTVANGQTSITAGNITQYSGAPILSETLTQKISQATGDGRYAALAGAVAQLFSVAPATQPQHAVQLAQLQSSVGSTGAASSRNKLFNSGAQVAIQSTVPTLTTSPQYGPVEMIAAWASGGAITAGTLTQDTAAPVGRTGYAAKLAGCTLTGAGQVSWRYRMEAADAVKFKNQTGTFQIGVQHDVGSAINYTVVFRKPTTTADDFSAVTTIGTSSASSVASATGAVVTATQALGDCSKGLEIEVQVACGAVTTKNFWFTEWQLEEGTVASAVTRKNYPDDLKDCQRYALNVPVGALFISGWAGSVSAPVGTCGIDYPVEMRVAPSVPSISFSLTQCNTPVINYNSTRCLRLAATGTVASGSAGAANNAAFVITARL